MRMALLLLFVWLQGKLVDMFVGLPSEQQLSSFINKLLSASPVPAAEQVRRTSQPPEPQRPQRCRGTTSTTWRA